MLKSSLLATCLMMLAGPDECAGFGNSHSENAIKSTGQVHAQDALRMLDSTVSVGH